MLMTPGVDDQIGSWMLYWKLHLHHSSNLQERKQAFSDLFVQRPCFVVAEKFKIALNYLLHYLTKDIYIKSNINQIYSGITCGRMLNGELYT